VEEEEEEEEEEKGCTRPKVPSTTRDTPGDSHPAIRSHTVYLPPLLLLLLITLLLLLLLLLLLPPESQGMMA